MNAATFAALKTKLLGATWTLQNALTEPKILKTIIADQAVRIYNMENGGLFINNRRANLTDAQESEIIDLADDIVDNKTIEIQQEQTEQDQLLNQAIDAIVNS